MSLGRITSISLAEKLQAPLPAGPSLSQAAPGQIYAAMSFTT